MVEVPYELSLACELEDAVLRPRPSYPHESFRVGNHGLKRRRPLRDEARAAPCMDDVAFLVELDQLGSSHAAFDAFVASTDLIAFGGLSAIQEPDVIHVIHMDAGDLLHAPAIGQRLGPERIDLEDRRAALVDGLPGGLRLHSIARADGQRQSATQYKNQRKGTLVHSHRIVSPSHAVSMRTNFSVSLYLRGPCYLAGSERTRPTAYC